MSRSTVSAGNDQGSKQPGTGKTPGKHGPLVRITVNLTMRASRALDLASQLTGDTRTDTINRALQVYAYLEQVTQDGGTILVQESADAEPRLIKMFL